MAFCRYLAYCDRCLVRIRSISDEAGIGANKLGLREEIAPKSSILCAAGTQQLAAAFLWPDALEGSASYLEGLARYWKSHPEAAFAYMLSKDWRWLQGVADKVVTLTLASLRCPIPLT